jgi:hypothetical protein
VYAGLEDGFEEALPLHSSSSWYFVHVSTLALGMYKSFLMDSPRTILVNKYRTREGTSHTMLNIG